MTDYIFAVIMGLLVSVLFLELATILVFLVAQIWRHFYD